MNCIFDDNIKRIILENINITKAERSLNSEKINVNLQIEIIYKDDDYNINFKTEKKIAEYIRKWLYEVKSNELKPSSFDRKEQTIDYQIVPYIGDITLDKLSSDDIQQMINQLKNIYSYSTIKKAYEALNSCLKYAVKKRDLQFNPAECISLPKNIERPQNTIHYFSETQIKKIEIEAIRCYNTGKRVYRLGEIVIFLLNTGMRIGEALALKWTDIDLKNKNVKVRKNVVFVKNRDSSIQNNYKYQEQNTTKTKSGSRIIPLNSEAIKALLSLKTINGESEYVFATSSGKRICPRNIDRMFRSILSNCSIESTGVHSLRHTFASRLFAKGVDVKTVSELLGHSEVGITYDTYIHLIQEQHVVAVETLENVL